MGKTVGKTDSGNIRSIILLVLLGFLFFYLVYMGYMIIERSEKVYEKSVAMADAAKAPEKVCTACIREGYAQALLFLSVALGIVFLIFLLPRLQSIGFGGFNITLRELAGDVENLKRQANEIQETITDSGGGKNLSEEQRLEVKQVIAKTKRELVDSNDPQKNQWGSHFIAGGRKLWAEVLPTNLKNLYRVRIWVESVKDSSPLKGFVTFHLHPTFKNQNPIIAVKNGIAELKLPYVYGAFTVGAQVDDGKTELELDLATDIPGVPEDFKSR